MTQLKRLLEDIDGLDPFPRVAMQVLELANSDAAPEELVAVIDGDPGLTAKILALANSAEQGSQVEICSIRQATARLGMRAVGNLALTSGVASHLEGYGFSTGRSGASLWSECLHIALFSRQLALKDERLDPEMVYTVGLLQNIGHIAVDRFMHECAADVEDRLLHGVDLLTAERELLGLDHAQCGALMARRWGLPPALIRGIQFHHEPTNAGEEDLLCRICALAESLTAELLEGTNPLMHYSREQQDSALLEQLGDDLEQIKAIVQLEFATIEG